MSRRSGKLARSDIYRDSVRHLSLTIAILLYFSERYFRITFPA